AVLGMLIPGIAHAQSTPSDKPVFQDGQVIAPLYRANLYVRDIDTSLKLYRDILKLKIVSDQAWDPRAHGLDTDIQVREVILSAGNPALGNLALYHITGQKEEVRKPFLEPYGHTADVATVWSTKDIWNINDEVHAAGYIVLAPPVTLLANPNMLVQSVEMQFRDADGFLVNLLQGGIAKDSPEAATAKIPDHLPEVMGTRENTSSEARIPRFVSKATPEPIYPGQRIAPMSRTTTFGRDRDASLIFYRDTLGMTQLMSNYWKGTGINRIKNVHGLEQWAVILMAGDSSNGNIGVYQLYGEKLDIPPPNKAPVPQIGDRGLSLVTKDIEGLHRKYRAAGFQTLTPPTAVQGGSTTEMMIRDPDGSIVTFVQLNG
ncbi:MAG: VOC family protein, partial [Rhodobacteraceae bacterium]|nr:VOC family protein [Paracoccaceae bacterium]